MAIPRTDSAASATMVGGTKVTPKPKAKPAASKTDSAATVVGGTKVTPKPKSTASTSDVVATYVGGTFIQSLKSKLEETNVALGLNPDGSKKADKPLSSDELNLKNEQAGPPGQAPEGFTYRFTKSPEGGFWKLYADTPSDTGKSTPTTSIDVLKALIKGQGFSSSIVESSATYLNALLKDNLDYDNAIEVFLNTKDYTLKNGTKITSPFYTAYGYLNEELTSPKTAGEIFNAVEGYKELKDKYGFSDKYLSSESLKGYVKNNVTVADLDERANAARLASITADPNKTAAFMRLGYIKDPTGLQDFYMDSKIGKEQLETNRNTGAFVAEAIRRAGRGIQVGENQIKDFTKVAAEMTAKGYTEAQISQLASTGFENIAQTVNPLVKYAGIYEKVGGTAATNQALTEEVQQSLVAEEFLGTASERRKRLTEQNARAFQGTAGLTSGSLKTTGMI